MSDSEDQLDFCERLAKDIIDESSGDDPTVEQKLLCIAAKFLLDEVLAIRDFVKSEIDVSPNDWLRFGGSLQWHCANIGKRIESPAEFAKWKKRIETLRQSSIGRALRPGRRAIAREVVHFSRAKTWQEFVDYAGNEHDFEELQICASACKSNSGEIVRYDLQDYKNDKKSTLSPSSIPSLRSKK